MIQDVQSGADTRAIAINQVGICRLKLPMTFSEDGATQSTIGCWSVSTNLAKEFRGTHMSRLVRILHDKGQVCDFPAICELPSLLNESLKSTEAYLAVEFPFFIGKSAPVSGEKGYIDAVVKIIVGLQQNKQRNLLQVLTPVTSLCPCSKAISAYGAHNQRSHITLTVEIDAHSQVRIRDLAAMAEGSSSCGLYSVLKRSDERHVTEAAYDNPKFVEDITRDLAIYMERAPDIKNYRIETENFESIHNHSAFAIVQSADFPAALLANC